MNNSIDLVSVIIPVYKVEKYLRKCIESVINQTYSYLEIILVDDGSPDNCPQICDEYAKNDNRIKVLHKVNGGLSDARNEGLRNATGKYVIFVDSDDTISPDMIEVLHKECRNEETIVVGDYKYVKENDNIVFENNSFHIKEINKDEVMYLYSDSVTRWVTACWKLYDMKLFENIQFPKNRFYEDIFTTYKLFHKASCIIDIPYQGYYYLQRENSIMNQYGYTKYEDFFDARIESMLFWKKKGYTSAYIRQGEIIEYRLHELYLEYKITRNKIIKEVIKKYYPIYFWNIYSSLSWKRRIMGLYNILLGRA